MIKLSELIDYLLEDVMSLLFAGMADDLLLAMPVSPASYCEASTPAVLFFTISIFFRIQNMEAV